MEQVSPLSFATFFSSQWWFIMETQQRVLAGWSCPEWLLRDTREKIKTSFLEKKSNIIVKKILSIVGGGELLNPHPQGFWSLSFELLFNACTDKYILYVHCIWEDWRDFCPSKSKYSSKYVCIKSIRAWSNFASNGIKTFYGSHWTENWNSSIQLQQIALSTGILSTF